MRLVRKYVMAGSLSVSVVRSATQPNPNQTP